MTTTKESTHLYLDSDLKAWLQAEAKRCRCSVSAIIQRLVMAEMEKQGDEKR